jgi:two-component system, OmpR family, sensor kinase
VTKTAAHKLSGRWRRLGITRRLMIGHTLLLVVVIGSIVAQSNQVFVHRLQRELDNDLAEEIPEYNNAADTRPAGQDLKAFTVRYLQTHILRRGHLLAVSINAPTPAQAPTDVLTTPGAQFLTSVPAVSAWLAAPPRAGTMITLGVAQGQYRILASPIVAGGHPVGTLVAAVNMNTLNTDRRDQLALGVAEGLAALIAAVAGGYLLLRRVLRTVTKVTRVAEQASGGDLGQRLPYDGPDDEVGRLARTVNDMLARLDGAFGAQRRLLADVSHQLRTPLTVIRGHLEVLERTPGANASERAETIALVIDEVEQTSLMVERLLLLGQALEPDFVLDETVNLPALLDEVFDAAQVMGTRTWSLPAIPDVTVRADRAKLRGALLNLVDNAVKATGEGDTIEISAHLDRDLVLEVADSGRGISAEDQQAVFDRFRRSGQSAYRGSGLGLAIVKAVTEAHGGRVELTSGVGHGCRIRLILPRQRVTPRVPPESAVAPVS